MFKYTTKLGEGRRRGHRRYIDEVESVFVDAHQKRPLFRC